MPVVTVGSTLAVDQYHCCQADLARDPDSALPDRRSTGPQTRELLHKQNNKVR